MPKQSKIDALGLSATVLGLYEDGLSPEAISKKIKSDYGESISNMGVRRWKESHDEKVMLGEIKKADDITDVTNPIYNDFKREMIKINQDINEIINEAKKDKDYKMLLMSVDQLRKNHLALLKTVETRIKPITNLTINQDVQVVNFLRDAGPFCSSCSAKIDRSTRRWLKDFVDIEKVIDIQ